METLTSEQIKEIAEQLDAGFNCYWNRKNNELLFIPDEIHHPDMERKFWNEEIKKLKKNYKDYAEIETLESHESFKIMAQFVDTITDSDKLRERLIDAMNRRKPFREFKFVIDSSGGYREKWFAFKAEKLQEWVRDRIESLNDFEI